MGVAHGNSAIFNVILPRLSWVSTSNPADGEREEEEDQVGGSVGPAESGVGDFLPHSIEQNSPK